MKSIIVIITACLYINTSYADTIIKTFSDIRFKKISDLQNVSPICLGGRNRLQVLPDGKSMFINWTENYRSIDGGSTFEMLPKAGGGGAAINSKGELIGGRSEYTGEHGGIISTSICSSSDLGLTYGKCISLPPAVGSRDLVVGRDDVIYLATNDGLYSSYDSPYYGPGFSKKYLGYLGDVYRVFVDDDNRIYALTSEGEKISTDNGKTFQDLPFILSQNGDSAVFGNGSIVHMSNHTYYAPNGTVLSFYKRFDQPPVKTNIDNPDLRTYCSEANHADAFGRIICRATLKDESGLVITDGSKIEFKAAKDGLGVGVVVGISSDNNGKVYVIMKEGSANSCIGEHKNLGLYISE